MSVSACFHLAAFHHFFRVVPANTEALRKVCYRLRHKVYCEECGFEPKRRNKLEQDVWDDDSIHCLVQNVVTEEYVACARLIVPPLADSGMTLPIQALCGGGDVSQALTESAAVSRLIAEVSRLAIMADYRRGGSAPSSHATSEGPDRSSHPAVLSGLLLGLLALARQHGIETTYMLVEPRLARYLATFMKFQTEIVGGPIEHHGSRLVAVVNVPKTIHNLRSLTRSIYETILAGLPSLKAPADLMLQPGNRAVTTLSRPVRFA